MKSSKPILTPKDIATIKVAMQYELLHFRKELMREIRKELAKGDKAKQEK